MMMNDKKAEDEEREREKGRRGNDREKILFHLFIIII